MGFTVIAPGSRLEDDVFFGPSVMVTNDPSIGRSAQTHVPVRGTLARRACRVGASVVLLPGVEIGEEAVVGAGSVVTRSVPARTLVRGAPAKTVRRVDPHEQL
jgi:acetyltransferase-like isoleucine patch superfamily enzyme